MVEENPSRDSSSRQQSGERAQTGSTSQQGSATQRGGQTGAGYGSGAQGQGTQGHSGQGAYGQSGQVTRGGTGTNWQGGRSGQGGALQRQGTSSMSPHSDYSSGYGLGPFSIMRRINDEMDRLFDSFGFGRSMLTGEGQSGQGSGQQGGQAAASMWSPHIEVYEQGGKLVIQADLPGIKRDDVNVRIEPDAVVIQGQRHQSQSGGEGGYYRSERSYGSFYRTIPLPEGTDTDSATATFRDGVLHIEVDAPREQQRGRSLEIRDAGSATGAGVGTGSGSTYAGSASQQSGSGTAGSQQSSGSGTMYSGSGDPSAGAAGMGGGSSDKSQTSRS
jgi:HSP20 family protein